FSARIKDSCTAGGAREERSNNRRRKLCNGTGHVQAERGLRGCRIRLLEHAHAVEPAIRSGGFPVECLDDTACARKVIGPGKRLPAGFGRGFGSAFDAVATARLRAKTQ